MGKELSRRDFLKLGALTGLGLFTEPRRPVLAKEASLEKKLTFYFPETGHNLEGPFLEFWRTNGGRFIFGDPITEVTSSGMPMQYFQKARLELHPNNQIMLGLLGSELFEDKGFTPILGSPNTPKFSRFYKTRGGEEIFGYPISPLLEEEGQLVQYFQRAKFEYHPEVVDPFYQEKEKYYGITLLSLNEIQLANLGEAVVRKKGLSFSKVEPKENAVDFSSFTPSKKIIIDLTEQKLIAYEDDTPVIVTDISSGRKAAPTITGKFTITQRNKELRYQGINDRGEDYNYPRVPFNLLFYWNGSFIHGAYWHDKFGKNKDYGVSLGCVNLDLDFAKQVFDWTPIGTLVEIGYF